MRTGILRVAARPVTSMLKAFVSPASALGLTNIVLTGSAAVSVLGLSMSAFKRGSRIVKEGPVSRVKMAVPTVSTAYSVWGNTSTYSRLHKSTYNLVQSLYKLRHRGYYY